MTSVRVAGFTPARCGFPFANDFDAAPIFTVTVPLVGEIPIGDAAGGMCGGMVFATLDLFLFHLSPPDGPAPKPGTPLFEYLAKRLLDSFNGPAGVYKYFEWMRLPNESHVFGLFKSIRWYTVNTEWPAIRADLDSGHLCPLGLIKVESVNPLQVGENHQVLAYGYDLDEASGKLTVYVYDPNEPGNDNVTLAVNIADSDNPSAIAYSADPAGRGFFRTLYTPADPAAALSAG